MFMLKSVLQAKLYVNNFFINIYSCIQEDYYIKIQIQSALKQKIFEKKTSERQKKQNILVYLKCPKKFRIYKKCY